ncbi:MAG: hypothetical protein LPH21_19495 [Shewanella sp.]|nr:hypothetical protein [Shewanella sp.]
MLGDVFAGWQLIEKIKGVFKDRQKSAAVESPASRFFALFNAHGVKPSQIPEFFSNGLTITDCHSEESLTKVLTPELLNTAAHMFGVRKDWLDCASAEIYPVENFYKAPESFDKFIEALLVAQQEDTYADVFLPIPRTQYFPDEDGLLVLCLPIGTINQRTVYRLVLVRFDNASYWKSRGYMAANLSSLLQRRVPVYGKYAEAEAFAKFANGEALPAYDYDSQNPLAIRFRGRFYVDELISRPERYLEGVDPERDSFGHEAAMGLWLELEGRMNIDPLTHPKTVEAFAKACSALKAE